MMTLKRGDPIRITLEDAPDFYSCTFGMVVGVHTDGRPKVKFRDYRHLRTTEFKAILEIHQVFIKGSFTEYQFVRRVHVGEFEHPSSNATPKLGPPCQSNASLNYPSTSPRIERPCVSRKDTMKSIPVLSEEKEDISSSSFQTIPAALPS